MLFLYFIKKNENDNDSDQSNANVHRESHIVILGVDLRGPGCKCQASKWHLSHDPNVGAHIALSKPVNVTAQCFTQFQTGWPPWVFQIELCAIKTD